VRDGLTLRALDHEAVGGDPGAMLSARAISEHDS
jgi:hypothetical protein